MFNLKVVIIVLVIAILGFAAFFYFKGGEESTSLTSEAPSSSSRGQNIIRTLNILEALTLSDSIYNRPDLKSLKDFSVAVEREPVGRANPFAPIEADLGLEDE